MVPLSVNLEGSLRNQGWCPTLHGLASPFLVNDRIERVLVAIVYSLSLEKVQLVGGLHDQHDP